MIPLYGFLESDTLGLLVLAEESDTVQNLIEKLKASARVRVQPKPGGELIYKGKILDHRLRVGQVDFEALDRFDVVWELT